MTAADSTGGATAVEVVRVCAVSDVAEGTARRVEVGNCPIAIVRAEGTFYAVGDTCSHANVSLSEGEVEGRTLECWLHGSAFDLETGRPTSLPATVPVPTYPVRVDGDSVLVAVPADSNQQQESS